MLLYGRSCDTMSKPRNLLMYHPSQASGSVRAVEPRQRGDASGSDDGSQGGQGVSDRGGSDSRSGTGETTHFEWREHHGAAAGWQSSRADAGPGGERRGSSSGPIVNEILGGTRIPGVTMDGRLDDGVAASSERFHRVTGRRR